jgi:hypothetical protein
MIIRGVKWTLRNIENNAISYFTHLYGTGLLTANVSVAIGFINIFLDR